MFGGGKIVNDYYVYCIVIRLSKDGKNLFQPKEL